ncbi:UPF0187 protein [Seminavis robusta]|uniref:UPF0187 protein n=1 Tax=Seminavis robusta TaxID=568900 RepID=A0A9N8HL49_9STRA|nr:UPF0187 protein [Seminavis robusta]|eukprot:Sro659_g182830.1 UPF0187 protein (472) ;mRNA; f:2843-4381
MKFTALILTAFIASAQGFGVPSPKVSSPKVLVPAATQLESTSTGWDSFINANSRESQDIPDGEAQRQFRRTVYTHDDWKKHRSQDRFLFYLGAVFKSGVYKNLAREVALTTAIAAVVCIYNGLVGGLVGLDGVQQEPILAADFLVKIGLPLTPFTLASSSLGLLLVFRTNTSYQRWDEARKNWGMNINHTRDLVRMVNTFYDSTGVSPEQRADDLNHVALCTWSFVRAMKRHLSPEEEDEQAFRAELYEKLPQQQAEMIIDAAHRPNRALQDLSFAIDDCPMHFMRKNEVHRAVTIFEDDLGSSERLLTSPVPVFYSRHLSRMLFVWLALVPFALYDPFGSTWNHVGMIPATAVLSVFLFGIEELGTQLEEPFTILPMQAFCDKIYNWCMEIMSWSPGDNGRPMTPIRPEHQYFASVPVPQESLYTEVYQSYEEPAPGPVYEEPANGGANGGAAAGDISMADFLKSQNPSI